MGRKWRVEDGEGGGRGEEGWRVAREGLREGEGGGMGGEGWRMGRVRVGERRGWKKSRGG